MKSSERNETLTLKEEKAAQELSFLEG